MCGNGAPSMGHRTATGAVPHALRMVKTIVSAKEGLPVSVKTVDWNVYAKKRIVVTPFAVFSLVIYDASFNLNFSGGQVALEVFHVCLGVPEAPFNEGEKLEFFCFCADVFQRHFVHFTAPPGGHKEQYGCLQAVFCACDTGVSHAVAALILVQWSTAGLPAWIPHGVTVLDIIIAAAIVHGDAVIAVTQYAAELCILAEAIAAGGIGNQGKEILRAQIVYPWPRCCRICYYKLPCRIFKMAVLFHSLGLSNFKDKQ